MSKPNHTPGPWQIGGIANRDALLYDQSGLAICNCITYYNKRTNQEKIANARLITAAPELPDAIRMIVEYMGYSYEGEDKQHTHNPIMESIKKWRELIDRVDGK